jgi:hypothetical protein
MGPELRFSDEMPWDPLSFDIFPGEPGSRRIEVSDDHRRLMFALEQTGRTIALTGGPLPYAADVRIHRGDAPLTAGRVGQVISM